MAKFNSYKYLREYYPGFIIMIKAGCFYEVRDEDAEVFNDIFKYRLYDENFKMFSRIKTGFPLNSVEKVTTMLRKCDLNYIIVEDYNIVEKYADGEVQLNDQPDKVRVVNAKSKVLCKDVNTGAVEWISANSFFGRPLIGKAKEYKFRYIMPTGEAIELKIADIT